MDSGDSFAELLRVFEFGGMSIDESSVSQYALAEAHLRALLGPNLDASSKNVRRQAKAVPHEGCWQA